MSETAIPPEFEAEALAMEYVMGLLPDGEHQAAAARAQREEAFAAAVEKWARNCAPLLLEVRPQAPPAHVWANIAAALAAAPPAAAVVPFPVGGLWRNLNFWRGAALAAAAAALVLALRPTAPAPRPQEEAARLLALLEPSGAAPAAAASYDPAARRLFLSIGFEPPPDRSAELWLIPEGGEAVSLGLLQGRSVALTLAPAHAALARAGAVLAVTIEPPGGAPQGVATGPLISRGALLLP